MPVELSISAAASEFRLDRATVRRRILAAGLQPSGTKGGYPVYRLADLIPALVGGSAQDLDSMSPFERRAWVASERDRLKLEQERALLVASADAAQQFAAGFQLVTQCLDTLGDRLERDCGLGPVEVEHVERLLDRLREEMFRAQQAGGGA